MRHREEILAFVLCWAVPMIGVAQLRPLSGRPAVGPPVAQAKQTAADESRDPAEQRFPGGAALKTDPEYQRLLTRADQCVQEGRLDLAAVLWQRVLDEAGDTLMIQKVVAPVGPSSSPLMIYGSVAQQVEQTLSRLPPAALGSYRTTADAEARALLAAAGTDGEEEALGQVVRRFFLSSIGDDAAYKLACLALDRHDFLGASRLLNKLLTNHPDPSMPKSELHARLAVAAAHMQDRQTAEQTLSKLSADKGPRLPADVFDLIAAEVKRAVGQGSGGGLATAKDWHMLLGNASRSGHMVALPDATTNHTLSELWVRECLPTPGPSGDTAPNPSGQVAIDRFGVVQPSESAVVGSRDELIAQWRAGGWRPTGRLLFDGGRVYLKTPERLVCYGATALTDQPIWQSAWENRYELDSMSQHGAMVTISMDINFPRSIAGPKSAGEILLFGDRVHQSMSIADGVIYSLEGKRAASEPPRGRERSFQWGSAHAAGADELSERLSSERRQSAVDTRRERRGQGRRMDIGFLAAPTPCGGLLLTPVTDGGTIWLFGLDRATGKTIWKTYLCDEPQGGAAPWAEIVLAAEGREAYLTCGCGVVFAVDAVAGSVRWAVRYARDGKPNLAMRNMYGGNVNPTLDLSGWDDDTVIPYGRLLVVMSSDSDRLLTLDRTSGERIWESPRISPLGSVASYCLGVHGRGLFVAGKNVIRRYDIPSGRLVQEKVIEDSFGRGCVTEDAVYVPLKDSILKLDLELKRSLSQVGVALSSDEPIGNLFSDGDKLWVVGAGRMYAMTTLEHRLEMLAKQIAAGDTQSQLHRGRLHLKQGRTELAVADLRGAYGLFQAQLSADEAAQRLIAAVSELKLSQIDPIMTLALVKELFITVRESQELSRESLLRRSDVVASSINNIRQHRPAGSIAALLSAAPLLSEDYLLTSASFAVDTVADGKDVPRLIESIEGGSTELQLISIRAAVRLAPDDVKTPLAKLLNNGDDRVRLVAARASANVGERKGVLEALVKLVESPSIAVRLQSHQSLQALTGQRIPFAVEGSADDRTATVKAWQAWIASHGATARLNLPLTDRAIVLGRMLFVSTGAVVELDSDHKERWKMQLPGAAWGCQGLPNGHRLVAINSHATVIEYDEGGKEVWRKDRLPAPPTSVQRLGNGNTLVACGNVHQIVEISPDGSTNVIHVPGHPISAQRLDSGTTLVALQETQRVVEVDGSGKILWEARTGGHPPWHAVRLENGNTLVTLTQARKVVEYDPTGRTIVWSTQAPLVNPYAAQRLASGNTMVADHTGVQEFDVAGKPVPWRHRQQQVTGLSSF